MTLANDDFAPVQCSMSVVQDAKALIFLASTDAKVLKFRRALSLNFSYRLWNLNPDDYFQTRVLGLDFL